MNDPDKFGPIIYKHIPDKHSHLKISEEEFNEYSEYLRATGQSNISPTKKWVWGLLLILMVGEAAGTGALISEFVSTTITHNELIFFTWGVAFFLAVTLVLMTHKAGSSLFIKNHISMMLGNVDPSTKTSPYEPSKGEFVDITNPREIRFLKRMDRQRLQGTSYWAFGCAIGLLLVSIGVIGVRWYGIQRQTDTETLVSTPTFSLKNTSSEPTTKTWTEKEGQIQREKHSQAIYAVLLLTLLYIFVQGFGFNIGYSHTFFNARGLKAYASTKGEIDYASYHRKYMASEK